MNILITGASGLLGSSLVDMINSDYNVYTTARKNFKNNIHKKFLSFDLRNRSYDKLLTWSNPDVIVHCAAITNVDYCDLNSEEAFLINYESLKKLSNYSSVSKIIFISSDAVFNGIEINPTEKSATSPLNIYGVSKLRSEQFLLDKGHNNTIIRTTIVGKNKNRKASNSLVEWIINSVNENKKIQLFNDVFFNPITTWSLSNEIMYILKRDLNGLFHIAGNESISKYEFGIKICQALRLDSSFIEIASIKKSNFIAKRSSNQSLDCSFYKKMTGRKLPKINQTIFEFVKYYKKNGNI